MVGLRQLDAMLTYKGPGDREIFSAIFDQ